MSNKILFSICGIGLLLVVVGLVGWLGVMPSVLHDKLSSQLQISPSNRDVYDVFKEVPVPIKFNIWLFEANPKSFDGQNVNTITYKMIGPYVFDEVRYKEKIEISENGNNITFLQKKKYAFNAINSCKNCKPTDEVNLYNVFHVSESDTDEHLTRRGSARNLKYQISNIYIQTVWIFAMFNDLKKPLKPFFIISPSCGLIWLDQSLEKDALNKLRSMAIMFNQSQLLALYDSLTYTDKVWELTLGKSENLGRSLLGFDDPSPMVIDTGKSSIDNILQFIQYDFNRNLEVWPNDVDDDNQTKISVCNQLRGTDGSQFKPGLTGDEKLYVFAPEICSILFAENKPLPNVEVYGIPTLRYVISKENFAKTEANLCHCLEKDPSECLPGMLNLRKCPSSKDSEAIVSPGLFYSQPEHIALLGLDKIININETTEENYGSTLDVEPTTGLVLQAKKKLTFSMKVRKNAVPKLKNLTDDWQYAPLLYVEEIAKIDAENADLLKEKLFPKKLMTGILITLTVVGILIIIGSAIMYFNNR